MRFGSFMEFHSRPPGPEADAFAESFAHVRMAEEWGLDGVWLAETHFNPERSLLSSPLIVAAAIAGMTKRLAIGTAVHLLPLGNPLRTAEETATLDQVSNGRLEFGVGRSSMPGSYEGYGVPYSESKERMFESLSVIIAAWTQDRFTHHGTYFSYENVRLAPKPLQRPHPPVRIAATTDDTFTALGEMGMPIFIGIRNTTLAHLSAQVREYERAWRGAGHAGAPDVMLRLPVYVAPTRERALTEPEESFMRQFTRLGQQYSTTAVRAGADRDERAARAQHLASLTWQQVLEEKVAAGTPEMVADRLQMLREELGLSGVVAEFNAGEKLPAEAVAASLRLFCERVAPAFR